MRIMIIVSFTSRQGSCSRSAPPHGPTPRTTTARRAQPFSASDLRRSSSTSRPVTACLRLRAYGLRNRVPSHATTQDWLILILVLTTVVAQRIIVAGPLATGPRLGLRSLRASLSLHTCLRFCGVVRRCRRSSTAAAGEATSCSVLMSL